MAIVCLVSQVPTVVVYVGGKRKRDVRNVPGAAGMLLYLLIYVGSAADSYSASHGYHILDGITATWSSDIRYWLRITNINSMNCIAFPPTSKPNLGKPYKDTDSVASALR